MNGSSLVVVLLLLGIALGALLLFSTPPPAPAATAVSTGSSSEFVMGQTELAQPLAVNAGADRTVGERESIRLDGSSRGGSGAVAYRWTSSSNLGYFSDPTRADAIYTAPSACDCCQDVTLTLFVTDRSGATANDAAVLRIRDPIACPPLRGCGDVALAVAPACPPPPCPARVKTLCPEPDIPCDGPCVSYAPDRPACGQVPVPCRCAGECGPSWDSSWPQIVPRLLPEERPAPFIVRQFPTHVVEGSATPLRALVRNPACSSVCFAWSASQGWFERGDTLEPIYHAPTVQRADGERIAITLTIHDATGRPSVDQIRIQIDDAPSS
jgi:hypothetical protein